MRIVVYYYQCYVFFVMKTGKYQSAYCDKINYKCQFCKAMTNIVKRKEFLMKKPRCFCCLKAGHLSKQCTSKVTGHNGLGRHHIAVCEARQNVKSAALRPNFPAFQHLQEQMSTITTPVAHKNNYSTTYTVSADAPKDCATLDSDRFYQWGKWLLAFYQWI